MKIFKIGIFWLFIICTFFRGNSQSTATAQVSTFQLRAPQLDTLKNIWVYLPISYPTSEKSYPVLYLQDAQNLFDVSTSYAGEWRIDETLDSLQADLIVVGIEHGNAKRIDELTPFPNSKYGGGQAEAYLNFILQTLKPEIDRRFRTKKGRDYTYIGGSSLGGLFSFFAILKQPEVFGKAVVFSPSFWFSEDIFNFTKTIPNKKLSHIRLYFRAGEKEGEEMVPLMDKMKKLLLSKGVKPFQINSKPLPEGVHNETFWSSLFPFAANWLLEKPSPNK